MTTKRCSVRASLGRGALAGAALWALGSLAACGARGDGSGAGGAGVVGGAGGTVATGGTLAAGGGAGIGGATANGGALDGRSGSAGADSRELTDYLGAPDYPDSFWNPVTPAEAGIDGATLQAGVDWLNGSAWEVHSFLVAYRGQLVLEQYGWTSGGEASAGASPHRILPTERHLQFSCTKSVLSALVGIAIAEGLFSGVDEVVASWFSDYDTLNPSSEKSAITLEDLLTMRSGLPWAGDFEESTHDAPDPARAMLSRDVVDTVGVDWNYSSGVADIVAEMLRTATGRTPLEYANERLFGPLGIAEPPWQAGENGTHYGGFGLELTSREMARFGELYRNAGVWEEQQLVPADWVETSTASHTNTAWGREYGYLWWVSNIPGFFLALGAYGQQIYVSQEDELVVVFTGDVPNESAANVYESVVRDYVLEAL